MLNKDAPKPNFVVEWFYLTLGMYTCFAVLDFEEEKKKESDVDSANASLGRKHRRSVGLSNPGKKSFEEKLHDESKPA